MARKHAFAPALDPGARVLILGSLPGDASLRAGQYYAHPRNAFWRLVGAAIDAELAGMPYPQRLEALRAAGIGLWDVIGSAERPGSLDAAIRMPQHAELAQLVGSLPSLGAVAFNGRTASQLGRRQLRTPPAGLVMIDLPSSSPAHARMGYDEKLRHWSVIARFLR